MFICDSCSQPEVTYDYQNKKYTCGHCGDEWIMSPVEKKCFNCGKTYTYYSWFDPSSCPHCSRSFVD
jgi:DNA-directed RNA polymerase subunit RPC12/RpoP